MTRERETSEDPIAYRLVHNGRGLTGQDDADAGHVTGWPEVFYTALRSMNHLTLPTAPMPAPLLYDILGNLKGVFMLAQLCDQLSAGLALSHDECDIREWDPARDPSDSLAEARTALWQAEELAQRLHEVLSAAQSAIAGQSCHPKAEECQ